MAEKVFSDIKAKMLDKVVKKVESLGEPNDIDMYFLGLISSACHKYEKDKDSSGFVSISERFPIVFKICPNLIKIVDKDVQAVIERNIDECEIKQFADEEELNWQKSFNELVGVVEGVKENSCEELNNIIDKLYYSELTSEC